MNKVKTIALFGCGAFLLVNNVNIANKYNKIDNKLEHITKHTVTHAWEETIQAQREVIDSLLLDQMDLGARLDSCIIVND
tara:strand:- start:288 stop:527 length:240 start_codon:yes stop_codon:yes gene_type:complete